MRVLLDVAAIDKEFDYTVPFELAGQVSVGSMVRVQLGPRRLGGWVVADAVGATLGIEARPISKVRGHGPSASIIELCRWAAWRWAGKAASFLTTASPELAVRHLPRPQTPPPLPADATPDWRLCSAGAAPSELERNTASVSEALSGGVTILRLPPAADPFEVVAQADASGPSLVLCPSVVQALDVGERLRSEGRRVAFLPREWARAAAGGVTVVGTRSAAFGPLPDLDLPGAAGAVIVLDAHDQSHASEAAPTWSAVGVAVERATRAGVPCVLVSPCPTLEHLALGRLVTQSRSEERAGWSVLDIVDRRSDDPRTGLYSTRLTRLLQSGSRVVCVLNRKGRARLLACRSCRELQRCATCQAAVSEASADRGEGLGCGRCGTERPRVCQHCGGTELKALRVGVTRVREELEALADRPVQEVTAETRGKAEDGPGARMPFGESSPSVFVGTEAVLHRVRRADVVCFLDFDQELLAPRYRASEQALALLARAARLVGPRGGGGRVLVQTRVPDHPVLQAALHGDPGRLVAVETPIRSALSFPPATALARVSGLPARAYVASLIAPETAGLEVLGPTDDKWIVRAADHRTLCDALAATPRPPGRLRVEIDPVRV